MYYDDDNYGYGEDESEKKSDILIYSNNNEVLAKLSRTLKKEVDNGVVETSSYDDAIIELFKRTDSVDGTNVHAVAVDFKSLISESPAFTWDTDEPWSKDLALDILHGHTNIETYSTSRHSALDLDPDMILFFNVPMEAKDEIEAKYPEVDVIMDTISPSKLAGKVVHVCERVI